MILPDYFLRRPPMPTDTKTLGAFERLAEVAAAGGGAQLTYNLEAPRWQFLCHIADSGRFLLHGSGNPHIDVFEPRKADDVNAFGDQQAVYAASDGLWPMYFAILDRDRYPMSLINSAVRPELPDGSVDDLIYFFSISEVARRQRPFRRGTVYLLPVDTFAAEDIVESDFGKVRSTQWASLEPVRPLAKLAIEPKDFPFLAQLRGHDDESTFRRARENPAGFPWIE